MVFFNEKSYSPLQIMVRDIFLKKYSTEWRKLKKLFTFDNNIFQVSQSSTI